MNLEQDIEITSGLYRSALEQAEAGDFDRALVTYGKLLSGSTRLNSLVAMVYNDIGVIRFAGGHKEAAAVLFRKAIFSDTLFEAAYINLARVNAEKVENQKRFSIVITVYNNFHQLKRCIAGIRKNSFFPYEIIIICDPATDGTLEYLENERGKGDITFTVNERHLGVARSLNKGLAMSSGDYVTFLAADCEVMPGWDLSVVLTIDNDIAAGAGAPLIILPKGEVQSAGQNNNYRSFNHKWIGRMPYMDSSYISGKPIRDFPEFQVPRECDYGYIAVMKRECLEKVCPLDEQFTHYYIDPDLGYKIQSEGYKNIFCPTSVVIHHDMSQKYSEQRHRGFLADQEKFGNKWGVLNQQQMMEFAYDLMDMVSNGEKSCDINPGDPETVVKLKKMVRLK